MPRDVVTIEEDIDDDSAPESDVEDDSAPETDIEDDFGPENTLPKVDSGATVNFMNEPVRKRAEQKKIRKKKLTKKEQSTKRKLAVARIVMALVKPDASTDKEKERYLRRIATKGVVQLFNAVAERQRTMSKTLQKKMTAKQRKAATEQFKGTFSVQNGYDVKEEEDGDNFVKKEEPEDESDEEDMLD